MWDSFEVIGAEQVDGQNLLAWKFYDSYSDSYNYETWEMSSDWSEWIESNWIERRLKKHSTTLKATLTKTSMLMDK